MWSAGQLVEADAHAKLEGGAAGCEGQKDAVPQCGHGGQVVEKRMLHTQLKGGTLNEGVGKCSASVWS